MLRKLLVLLLFFVFDVLHAQQLDVAEAVRLFVGDAEVETLDPTQVETLYGLYIRPIDINHASRPMLESTGLFSPFQLSSLIDYRNRHGYIMSMAELSSVDGFTSKIVSVLVPFISVEPQLQDNRRVDYFSGDIDLRYGYKVDQSKGVNKSMYGMKAKMSYAEKFTLALAMTEPYDSLHLYPTVYSASLSWQHMSGKVVIGDFNARFGQGLCVWNTASFSSLNSPSSFMKRPSGIAVVNSFTGSTALTGLAADFAIGRWRVSAMLPVSGIKQIVKYPEKLQLVPTVNLVRYGRFGHLGCTHMMAFSSFLSGDYRIPQMRTSFDGSCCLRGVNLFGEGVYDWVDGKFSVMAGSEYAIAENIRAASQVRYLPTSNEHGMAHAIESSWRVHQFIASIDALYHPQSKSKDGSESYQIRGQANWVWKISPIWQTRVRIAERYRTWGLDSKTEMRVETTCVYGKWKGTIRADALYGHSHAGLAYVEAGYLTGKLTAYVRYGMFHVDNWDDRIYVYERDAPGNFNVPSFYGRGLWVSAYLAYKPAEWCKLYVRGVYKKPGNAELKLYCSLRF